MRRKTDRVNSSDVARLAGTSQATVSRVFAKPETVRPETREKVLSAARALSYDRLNRMSSEMSPQRRNHGLIGVIIRDFQNPFYTAFVDQMTRRLNRVGKKVILFGNSSSNNIEEILAEAVSFRLSGLIIASTSLSEQLTARNLPTRIPVVLINRQEQSQNYCSVASDDIESSRFVADFFVNKGYRAFAYLAGAEEMQSSRRRQMGYVQRLAEWGFYQVQIEPGDFSYESGFQAMKRLIHRQIGQPVAILCANDLMGLGAIDAIREVSALRIPEDFALIGFDDIAESRWHSYGLSSMRIPVDDMINTAFEYLYTYDTDSPRCAGMHQFLCTLQERRTT